MKVLWNIHLLMFQSLGCWEGLRRGPCTSWSLLLVKVIESTPFLFHLVMGSWGLRCCPLQLPPPLKGTRKPFHELRGCSLSATVGWERRKKFTSRNKLLLIGVCRSYNNPRSVVAKWSSLFRVEAD